MYKKGVEMAKEILECDWPGEFKAYQAVIVRGERRAHVIPINRAFVPAGCVPVVYDDESECFENVPADDLRLRFPKPKQVSS